MVVAILQVTRFWRPEALGVSLRLGLGRPTPRRLVKKYIANVV